MSAAARIVLAALVAALVGLGGAYWWVSRPTPEPELVGQVRVLTADPDVELPYLLEIPTDPNGCPGYTVPAPGESRYEPAVGEDGGRSDAAIDLGGGSAILIVCSGPVSEVGTADEAVAFAIDGDYGDEYPSLPDVDLEQVGAVDEIRSAHGDGPALTSRIGRTLITDFYVEHDGYLHIVGYMRPEAVGDAHLPTVEAMLASWSWD